MPLAYFSRIFPTVVPWFTRYAYQLQNLIWIGFGLAATLTALTFFLDPTTLRDSPVGKVVHPFDYIWNVGYIVSGVLMGYGLLKRKRHVESLGLMLFGGSVLVYFLTVLATGAFTASSTLLPVIVLCATLRVMAMWALANQSLYVKRYAQDEVARQMRDTARDRERDLRRDTDRDAARDLVRDPARDPSRDSVRDPLRDGVRDRARDR